MRRPGDFSLTKLPAASASSPFRPGRVVDLRGIIFQSDASDPNGRYIIRPVEAFDRWQAGLSQGGKNSAPLAMHAGLHVVLEDGRQFVAEQLVGSWFEDFEDGMNWTPLETFRRRDRGGWDATVPPAAFRNVDAAAVAAAIIFLNAAKGRPFAAEDCTEFIERAFGGRRLFGDSPTARELGFGLRVGDPALPLLRSGFRLDERTSRLLRLETVAALPDACADHTAPNAHRWAGRIIVWGVLGTLIGTVARWCLARPKKKRRWLG